MVGMELWRCGVAGEGQWQLGEGDRWIANGNGSGQRVTGAGRMRAELTIARVRGAVRCRIVHSKQTLRGEQGKREQADVQDATIRAH